MGKTMILFLILILLSSIVIAVNYDYIYNPYTAKQDRSNSLNQSGLNISGNLPWSDLYDYPVACPEGTTITQLNDSVTCTEFNQGIQNSSAWNRSGTNVFLANSGDKVGIGTTTPTHELNVVGDANVTENLYIGGNLYSNYSYSKNQVSQFHRVATATAASTDTWYNITFDLEIDDETISDWYKLTDSNSSITINGFDGIIRVQGCIHPYNNDVGNQEASFYARVLVNGIEGRCLQRADSKSFKSSGISTLDVIGTVVVEDGDVITYQWRTTNTNIQLEGDAVFDNPVAASLNFERLSDLD